LPAYILWASIFRACIYLHEPRSKKKKKEKEKKEKEKKETKKKGTP
jgi:hypothetical protein